MRGPARTSRAVGAFLAAAFLAAAVVVGLAPPAAAHAVLLGTDPAEGTVLPEAPEEVVLSFSEPVDAVPDGVRVYDAAGEPVESSATLSGTKLAVVLDESLGDGTLVVVWRVLSEDGHPVGGSLTFSIGSPSSEVVRPPAQDPGPTDAPLLLSALRGVGYVALLLTAGLTVFTLLLVPVGLLSAGPRDRLRTTARAGAVATVLAWLTALPISLGYQLGGVGKLTRGGAWSAPLATELAVTLVVSLGTVVAVLLAGNGAPGQARRRWAVLACAGALAAPALSGHTRAASPEILVVATDLVHVTAGSVWLGGLAGLALVLPDLAGRGAVGAEVLTRFSVVAGGVLAVVAATGSLLAWRVLGSWSALTGTGYGQLLLMKLGIVAVVVVIAAWNRFTLLPRLRAADRRRDRRSTAGPVVRTAGIEAGLVVVLLLVTGVLVDKSPEAEAARQAAADTGPHVAEFGDLDVVAAISPHTPGPNTVTIQVRNFAGVATDALEPPRARLSSTGVDLGPLTLTRVAIATYTADVVLPEAGTWELQISLRTGEFETPVETLEFPVTGTG